jgi:hypothetical protein
MSYLKLNRYDYYIIVPFIIVLILTAILMALIQSNYFDADKLQPKDQLISVVATSITPLTHLFKSAPTSITFITYLLIIKHSMPMAGFGLRGLKK